MDQATKVRHVRAAKQTRGHTCHWPGCEQQVPPAMWGCKRHWFMLPKPLRDWIWRTYRPGQENDLDISELYLEAADAVQSWIREVGEPAIDPTPWCQICGAMQKAKCSCHPRAEND